VSYIFRKIDLARWAKDAPEYQSLLSNDVPSDACWDLRTKDGVLSVFELDDRAKINRVACALASGLDRCENVDYVLLPIERFEVLGLELRPEKGITTDGIVNEWHRDVVIHTASNLVRLARCFWDYGFLEFVLDDLIYEGIIGGLRTNDLKGVHKFWRDQYAKTTNNP
jgi:hypothetical protein